MYTMCLDESGDHSLDKVDPQFSVFVLAGCIFTDDYYETTVTKEMSKYKQGLFGDDGIILHTADITRNRRGFEAMKDPDFRQRFYELTNALVARLDFTVVACAIDKQKLINLYGESALDPYTLSLECVVERFVFFLQEKDGRGRIVVESRNPVLDRELDLAYQLLLNKGSRYVRPSRLKARLSGLSFSQKQENVPGLQVADLVATPIARAVIGKTSKEDYRIVEGKFRRREGKHLGPGLVIIPK